MVEQAAVNRSVVGSSPTPGARSLSPEAIERNFGGFSPLAFAFLRDLADNNDAVWFKPRKHEYDTLLRGPAVALAADIFSEAARLRFPLDGDPARAVFRPYRDVRFSADKRPYKTHVGIALTRSGRKDDPGVLYVHVLPGGCFVAAGFHQPERDALARLRHSIIAEQSVFRRVVAGLDAAGIPLEADPDAGKRLPRDCEAAAGTPVEPFVKAKSLIVRRHIPDALAADPGLVDAVMAFAQDAKPLLAFGWRALERR